MKVLIIGGNRFVGLRLSLLLDRTPGFELHILNRTGQAAHCRSAVVHKGDRRHLNNTNLDREWDVIFDFACFNQREAEESLRYFTRVKQYIFISSASVYDGGLHLRESAFNARHFDLRQPVLTGDYQDGKRRCEAVFAQQATFATLSVRFPFVLGPDDYTERLRFHIEHVERGEPIYAPNLNTHFSVLHSEDAAAFLQWSIGRPIQGALNVASAQSLSLAQLLAQIELSLKRPALAATEQSDDNHSPYGIEGPLVMDVAELSKLGFTCQETRAWLPALIAGPLRAPDFLH